MGKLNPTATGTHQGLVEGIFTGVGPSLPLVVDTNKNWAGYINAVLFGSTNTALTTTGGSASASAASATGLAAGQGVNSVNVPVGTTIGAISGTSITLAFPPGVTSASVVAGTDNAAIFNATPFSGTVQLERSFDGGKSYFPANIDSTGTAAAFTSGVSGAFKECERNVLWRWNCTAYASGSINYRLSY